MPPWRLFRPFLAVAATVSLLVAAISVYFAPEGMRMLRRALTDVRADLVTNIVQPGRFIPIEHGLTFHIRERRPNGLLVGIVLDDRRDPKERTTIIAEQGTIVQNGSGSFLVLENGNIQRQDARQRDPNIVLFDKTAFDLSQFTGGTQTINYSVRERYLWELLWPSPDDPMLMPQPAHVRAELHDRIMAPLYPFAFMAIAYTFLGAPRTTRQSRAWSTLAVIGGVGGLRLAGFGSTVFGVHIPAMLALQYFALIGTFAFSYHAISRGLIIEPPAALLRATDAIAEFAARHAGALLRAQR
jgi:lipopolysaccharide export system permease protein